MFYWQKSVEMSRRQWQCKQCLSYDVIDLCHALSWCNFYHVSFSVSLSHRRNRDWICADVINTIIAPLSDIPMLYIKYLTMHKVQMHASAIRQLLYGCAFVRELILPYINKNHTITYTWKFDKQCMSVILTYCTFEWYSNILHQISHNVQSTQACWCNKNIAWLCVCSVANPLAKARGLSSRTYAQTIQ